MAAGTPPSGYRRREGPYPIGDDEAQEMIASMSWKDKLDLIARIAGIGTEVAEQTALSLLRRHLADIEPQKHGLN